MHKSVLLSETVEGLNLHDGAVVVDGTFGGGGHSKEILKRYKGVKIIAIDEDRSVWGRVLGEVGNSEISFHEENFRNIDKVLQNEKVESVDAVVLDLGFSSDQLENSGRGFSFMKDEPLLMTFSEVPGSMKENSSSELLTAEDVVNEWGQENLEKIIRGYGEEKYAKRIARRIVESRKEKRIKTTTDLVSVIESAVGRARKGHAKGRTSKIHPATRTFQAIRIAVNDELGALQEGLSKSFAGLKSGGRMAVISFHSLEDRIVKNFYREKVKEEKAKLINKKPLVATEEEKKENPRARSAKLRIIEKI